MSKVRLGPYVDSLNTSRQNLKMGLKMCRCSARSLVCCCAPKVDHLCAEAVDQEREQEMLGIFGNCAILAPVNLARADWR